MIKPSSKLIMLFGVFLTIFFSCSNEETTKNFEYQTYNGKAQGTTYQIKCDLPDSVNLSGATFDSIFMSIDSALSLWKPYSLINEFNSTDSIRIRNPHFLNVFIRASEIESMTGGAFNLRVFPLVQAWGFIPGGGDTLTADSIQIILNTIGKPIIWKAKSDLNEKLVFVDFLKKNEQQIDVNGIAQGYTVDVLANFLDQKDISNYMIEVGGEVRTKGLNQRSENWTIGIDKPVKPEDGRELQTKVELVNQSIATSGTYRKFYIRNGRKFSHTIDPFTGYPVEHNLLSVSVKADNCTNADAFATAFMVLGVEKSIEFLEVHPELQLEAYFIFEDEEGDVKTKMTSKFKS